MPDYDLLIRNGTVIDGTGASRRVEDIAIVADRIVRIAPHIAGSAAREIDAAGRIVAPGVIDPHTHYDAQVHWDPYCTNSSLHGATSVVVGNCGFGFAPCRAADRTRYMAMMENTEQVPVAAMRSALSWDWESFPQWLAHMRRLPKGINLASYLPLNSLMIYVMGYEAAKSRAATPAERGRMRDLLHEAMDCGAIGFALSHLNQFNSHKDIDGTAMPTDEMFIDDAYHLASVLRDRGEGVIQCLAEIPGAVANRAVVEELAARSGRPVLHNITVAFDFAPVQHREILRWLDDCQTRGLDVYSQGFTFRAWNEFKTFDYNAWQHVPLFNTLSVIKGAAGQAALASDPAFRARARIEYDPVPMMSAGGPVETFRLHKAIGAASFAQYEGQLLSEIAAQTNALPIDVFFDIIAESGAQADFKTSEAISCDPDKVTEILENPRIMAGTSDGGAHVKFHAGGQYATDVVAWLSRDLGRFTLEQAHNKLSGVPAGVMGFAERGTLVEGNFADLYIYDLDALGYRHGEYDIVHDLPGGDWRRVCRAEGIDRVIVNGAPVLQDGMPTGATPGHILETATSMARTHEAVAAE